MPPIITMMRGPKRSTNQPSTGTSQVSVSDEETEGHLDGGAAPMMGLVDGIDEQIPAILKVGDHHHADDADNELEDATFMFPSACSVRHSASFLWNAVLRGRYSFSLPASLEPKYLWETS